MPDVAERVARHKWYHTIELSPDLVTRGWFDLRPYVRHYGLPDDLSGKRVLDIGTWDGFWAFEMERRGAAVVALDLDDERRLDWPPRRRPAQFSAEPRGAGFRLAHEALGSRVERVNCSIYDVMPENLGRFDLVFCGSVLLHLRDQVLALQRMAEVCSGRLILAEEYEPRLGWLPWATSRFLADREGAVVFWLPAARTWRRMAWVAGFDDVHEHSRFTMHDRDRTLAVRHVVLHGRTG